MVTTNGIVYLGNGNWSTAGTAELPTEIPNTVALSGGVGTVTVNSSGTDTDVTVNPTGVSASSAIGSVTVVGDAGTWDSTGETLDSTAQTYDEG